MYPFITIFGKQISTYGICAIIGILTVYGIVMLRCRIRRLDYDRAFYMVIIQLLCLFLGSGLLYQIQAIPHNFPLLKYLFTDFDYVRNNYYTGFVFYGGLFGVVIGPMITSKVFNWNLTEYFNISIPAFTVFHAITRVGCFLVGCCHGIACPTCGIAVAYTHSVVAENGIPYIPIQLFESAGNVIIATLLFILQQKRPFMRNCFKSLGLYFVLYGTMRFIDEYWRGDLIRGIYGPFSTSQWISLVVVPLGIYLLVCPASRCFMRKWYIGTKKKKPAAKSQQPRRA